MIDLHKLEKVYMERTKLTSGYTLVIQDWEKLQSLFKIFLSINNQIDIYFPQAYENYCSNLHITVIGLNGYEKLSMNKQIEIRKLFEKFPSLYIEGMRFSLRKNGLIIVEISLDKESKIKLSEYRKSFEKYGIFYKYPKKIERMHSVLGIFNPYKIKKYKLLKNKKSFKSIELFLKKKTLLYKSFKNEKIYFKQNAIIVHYHYTSLKDGNGMLVNILCKEE